jgi:hypothetical protein
MSARVFGLLAALAAAAIAIQAARWWWLVEYRGQGW